MPVAIQVIPNEHFKANTYLIKSRSNDNACYLIDIGNYVGVVNALLNQEYIKGIFLTHVHYDHICGINELMKKFPDCTIYCSKYTEEALQDSKMNLSFYHQTPITYKGNNIKIITQNDTVNLFDAITIETIETPGHNEGSLTFKIDTAIFTGDSLIPETPVVTKLKSGDKLEARKSVLKIQDFTNAADIIYPGHGKSFQGTKINWNFYL